MSAAPTGQRDTPSGYADRAGTGPGEDTRAAGWVARYVPVGVAAATMIVLGVWGLARQGAMGNDEVVTRWAAMLPLPGLGHLLEHTDIFHGFYYLLMHGWVAVGTSPTVLRIPSVAAMTVAVGLVVYLGRRLSGSAWTGLFAGLVMALTPTISFYAQTARSYAIVMVCVLCSTLALVRALESEVVSARITRRWLVYGALITLGGYLNELSLLVLAAHLATVALSRPARRTALHWAITGAAGALLVLPVVIISIREDAASSWITRPTLHDVGILFHDYFGAANLVSAGLLACAIVAILPGGGDPAWWRRGGICLPSVAAPLLVLPATVVMLESLVAKPLYVDRYVLYGEAGAALLSGAGICRIARWLGERAARWRPRPAGQRTGHAVNTATAVTGIAGVAACACVLVLQLAPQHRARTPQSRQFDYGTPSRFIGANQRPGDGVLFFNTFYRKAELGYPQDFRDIDDFALAMSPARSGTLNGHNKPVSQIRPLMLGYHRIWVVGRAPSAQVSSPAIRGEGELLMSRFRLALERHFKGIVVTLWIQR
ncbi:MAG TPA: glycosyltransferase family 39 protein [Streptosporangiaceae bacterium]|nr:glycosyltransferase family 39 protein [Streptosporangiaceae bacterium]